MLEEQMISKYLATALLTTALMTGAVTAQTTTTTRTDANNAATMHHEGQWRASKLVGVDVYNEGNEKIGDISEVILDKSGKVANVIIGVGGFLGMGEHYVAVAFDKLKWVNEPVRSTVATTNAPVSTVRNTDGTVRTTTAPATDGTARPATSPATTDNTVRPTTGAATTTTTTRSANEWYPDHVVYNATKDQLKAMPQFKY
jgi:sporulation protein YlmC with PRC-barrel domain